MERIDVRGLSCPNPLVMTEKMMKKLSEGSFEVICDTGTARANILRAAKGKGWKAEERKEGGDFVITLSRQRAKG